MSGRSERVVKRIGCVAIVAAAGVGLGLSVHHDVQFTASVTRAQYTAQVNAQLQQAECVYDAIRQEVPKGATVYLTYPLSTAADRLSEWSTLWAVPQTNIADAQYQLTLVSSRGQRIIFFPLTSGAPDPAKGRCEGLVLKVHRL